MSAGPDTRDASSEGSRRAGRAWWGCRWCERRCGGPGAGGGEGGPGASALPIAVAVAAALAQLPPLDVAHGSWGPSSRSSSLIQTSVIKHSAQVWKRGRAQRAGVGGARHTHTHTRWNRPGVERRGRPRRARAAVL
jgi:hypothetical protein